MKECQYWAKSDDGVIRCAKRFNILGGSNYFRSGLAVVRLENDRR
jgi:hypothetical protein